MTIEQKNELTKFFEDSSAIGKNDSVCHIYIEGIRYWVIFINIEKNIFRIEVHKNEICELFNHSHIVAQIRSHKDLINNEYFMLIKLAAKRMIDLHDMTVFHKKQLKDYLK